MQKVYYFDFGLYYRAWPGIGTCSQLRILNVLKSYCDDHNFLFMPRLTINGVDYYEKFFKREVTWDINKVEYIRIPSYEIQYTDELAFKYSDRFSQNVKFNDKFIERCDRIFDNLNKPSIGVHIRETDKIESEYVAFPTCLYENLIKSIDENIFISSDCNYSINQLTKYNNVKLLNTVRSENFLPMHRMHHIKLNKNREICELQHVEELLTELYIFTKLKRIYYGVFNGVILNAKLLNPSVELIPIESLLEVDIKEILKYYSVREKFLWTVIDQEINTGKDIPTTWIAPERTDLNDPI